MAGNIVMMPVPILGAPKSNARVDVYGTLNGSVKHVLTDASHPTGYVIEYTREDAIKIAINTLTAVGIKVNTNELQAEDLQAHIRGG